MKTISSDVLHYNVLQHDKCYLLDCNTQVRIFFEFSHRFQIFVWIGSKSLLKARRKVGYEADNLVSNRPAWVIIREELDGSESLFFQSKFVDWPPKNPTILVQKAKGKAPRTLFYGKLAKEKTRSVDVSSLVNDTNVAQSEEEEIQDECEGNAEVVTQFLHPRN